MNDRVAIKIERELDNGEFLHAVRWTTAQQIRAAQYPSEFLLSIYSDLLNKLDEETERKENK